MNPVEVIAEPLGCAALAGFDDPAPAPIDEPLPDAGGENPLGDTAAAPTEVIPVTGWNAGIVWIGAIALLLAVAGRRALRRSACSHMRP